jgi:hypothetical protein
MRKTATFLVLIGLAVLAVNVEPAAAQTGSNEYTTLAMAGNDSGTCVSSPCRSLTYALTQTSPGGHVSVLSDTGNWESMNENVTITGAVNIVGPGDTPASFGAMTGTALTINAGVNAQVTIHDMNVKNYGTATNGIVFNSGGALVLEHTKVSGFSNIGLTYSPNTSGGASTLFMYRDAEVTGNVGGNILLRPVGTTNVLADIKDSIIAISNVYGFKIDTTGGGAQARAEIADTIVASVGSNGITVNAPTYVGEVFATGIHISDAATYGVYANGANATIVLNNSSIIRSGVYGVADSAGGVVASYGNNQITLNANDNTGILTSRAPH